MPTTVYSNLGFAAGLLDPEYRHAAHEEFFNQAALTLTNFSILPSGAVRRRPSFVKKNNFVDATWAIVDPVDTAALYDNTEPALHIPFITPRRRLILTFQLNPATDNELHVDAYNIDADDWRTVNGAPLLYPGGSVWSDDDIKQMQYVQAGASMFFCLPRDAGLFFGSDGPGYVGRVYEAAAGTLHVEFVSFKHVLTGKWDYLGVATLTNSFPTPSDFGKNDGSTGPASQRDNVANFTNTIEEIANGDELAVRGRDGGVLWRTILDVDDLRVGVPTHTHQITLDDTPDTGATSDMIHAAGLQYRKALSGTNVQRFQTTYCVGFFEGRLVLATTSDDPDDITRVKISAANDPFLLHPSDYDVDESSPVDATLYSPTLDRILWVAGSKALFVAGSRGMSVVRPGLTSLSLNVDPVEAVGASRLMPAIDKSGVIYLSADGREIVRLDYSQNTDGFEPLYTSRRCLSHVSGITKIQVANGGGTSSKRILAVLSNGNLAVGHMNESKVSWSLFNTEVGDIVDVVAFEDDVYVIVEDASSQKALFKLVEDSNYVGDIVEAATLVASKWRCTDAALKSTKVGVVVTFAGTGPLSAVTTIYVGTFSTEADGDIVDEAGNYLHEVYADYTISSVTAYRVFGSKVVPTPAVPVRNEGQGFTPVKRVHRVSVGCSATRNFRVNGIHAFTEIPLGATLVERSPASEFVPFQDGAWQEGEDLQIEGFGLHQCTITGISREVTA